MRIIQTASPGLHGRALAGRLVAVLAMAFIASGLAGGSAVAEASSASGDALRRELGLQAGTTAAGTASAETRALRAFYQAHGFQPIWFSDGGPTAKARTLVGYLNRADTQGLRPADYHAKRLADAVGGGAPTRRAALEVLMSRAFVRYGADIRAGRIARPGRVTRSHALQTERPDPERLLAAAAGARDFSAFLDKLPPQTPQYRRLVGALAFYQAIAARGGWKSVPAGPTLKPGMNDPRVRLVRQRLLTSGDLKASGESDTDYTQAVATAVRRFQYRHGLTQDGSVGRGTLAAMNVPVAARIRQIVINLERRRWMPEDLGDRYIFVNIADQAVKLVIRGRSAKPKTIFAGPVIVGRAYQATPIFSATMTFIELNPHWNVPQSIARRELLPKIKRNPGYLAANHYLLLARPVDNASAVNPRSVAWSKITARTFPYWVRQTPGPWNALGSLVFRFPNPYNVYMHDTPAKTLFAREVRTFSHGCIRVKDPVKLALLLLAGNKEWTAQRIARTIKTRKPTTITLSDPVPVHVTYLTAWSNKDGTHHFRRDVYHRDDAVARQLAR